MSPELRSRVFELFAQADRNSDRSQGGLGLGLALVKSLVELHGGAVAVDSEGEQKGSTFTIVLPGATGWAQVHRDYCSSLEDNIEKLAYDLFYIKHISLSLDLLVFFKTVRVVLLGRGGR